MIVTTAIWTLASFIVGAVPFSLIIGRVVLGTDIRNHGDGNPGATNVLRAGSKGWAIAAVFLDMAKAALPVGLAYVTFDLRGYEIVPIAVAPLLGHLYSPFLKGHGGKGVAVTGGIWIGLTMGIATLVGIVFMSLGYLVQRGAGWAVALGMASIAIYLAVWQPDPVLLTVWACNTALILWRHRDDLGHRPIVRSWLLRENV